MNSNDTLFRIRKEYSASQLLETDLAANPIERFKEWYEQAITSGLLEPNAMVLATSDRHGQLSARTVLLKEFDQEGFVFYTNYLSAKGQDLDTNPRAAAVFLWKELERQVRLEGDVSKLPADQSDRYFATRPRDAQIGAHASAQSRVLSSREELMSKVKEAEERFKDKEVTRPEHWGGYLISPRKIEFWQGRENRLSDRLLYVREQSRWIIKRLAP